MCCEVLVTKSSIWQAEDEKNLFHEMSQIKSAKMSSFHGGQSVTNILGFSHRPNLDPIAAMN